MRFATASLLLASLGFTACDPELSTDLVDGEDLEGSTFAAEPEESLVPEWRFIPALLPSLQIHVCDETDAGTDDYVGVRFQMGLPTTKVQNGKTVIDRRPGVKQLLLDAPGDDFQRNGTYTFYFPDLGTVPGGLAQMGDLKNLEIFKNGTDALCIDRAALFIQGSKVWQFEADDAVGGTYLDPQKGTGKVWLDGQAEDAPSARLRFTDGVAKYEDRSTHGPIDLKVLTCASTNAGTDADVRLRWSHDGLAEMPVTLDKNKHDDFEEGKWGTYRLSNYEAIHRLDYLRIESKGTDALCVDRVQLFANGVKVFDDATNHTLDNAEEDKWTGFDYAINEIVETGSKVGRTGRPIRGNPFAQALDAKMATSATTELAYCQAPERFPLHHVKGIAAVDTGMAFWKKGEGFWGSSGHVSGSKKDANSLNLGVRFEGDAPGFGNGVFWVNMDLNVYCGDPDPEDDKDEIKLVLQPSNRRFDYDLPPVASVLNWFRDNVFNIKDFRDSIRKAINMEPRLFETQNGCPGITIESDGDIRLAWKPLKDKPTNALCHADSAKWGQ